MAPAQLSSESKLLNVAVIGYGMAAKVFHTPLISSVRGLRLSHIVSSKPDVVKQDWPDVAVLATPADAFAHPEIDLIVVATPNDSHFDLAQRALAAGKNVVVDKPFTTTVAEATELAALAKKSGRVLAVFQNRRWDGDFLTLRALISEARLGEVTHFESHYDRYRPLVRKRWREQPGPASGIWYDLGPHLVDQALQLFGVPEGIHADLEMQREGAQTVDYFNVTFRYGPGARDSACEFAGARGFAAIYRAWAGGELHQVRNGYAGGGFEARRASWGRGLGSGSAGWRVAHARGRCGIERGCADFAGILSGILRSGARDDFARGGESGAGGVWRFGDARFGGGGGEFCGAAGDCVWGGCRYKGVRRLWDCARTGEKSDPSLRSG